jgi:hypothetical protein
MTAERQQILDIVIGLFVATDERDWAKVASCFAESAVLDMTSLTGGAPVTLNGHQIAAGWKEGLQAIDHIHHQVGNFRVEIGENEAQVSCYGIAFHHRAIQNPNNVRTFVGTYDIHLIHSNSGWRINHFRFNLKFITGNLELEREY